jgi:14-3-3 protein epsilon
MSVLFIMAQTASAAERYEDTCHYMRLYIQEQVENNKLYLTRNERDILDLAYKRITSSLRIVIQRLDGILKDPTYDNLKSAIQEHKKEAQMKLSFVCNEICSLLEQTLIPGAEKHRNTHMLIVYTTMAGDYHRYISGLADESIQQAGKYYAQAYAYSQHTSPTSTVRLGVANNYSIYYYDVLNNKEKACSIAKAAAKAAAAKVNTLTEKEYNECMCVLEVLTANFEHWSAEVKNTCAT